MTYRWGIGAGLAIVAAACAMQMNPEQSIAVGESDLGGVVSSPNGPEAGVWVIAETVGLPTRYTKIVVTDERGRYVIPGLPKASYSVWVRGYGLVDSPKVQSEPARCSISPRYRPRMKLRRRSITRRSTGIRCSKFRALRSSAATAAFQRSARRPTG